MSKNIPFLKPDPYSILEQMEELNPEPSCSQYNILDSDLDSKLNIPLNNCMYSDLLAENETSKNENALLNYSNLNIYDENNNCMLTNLNEYGIRYFDLMESKTNSVSFECLDTFTEDRNLEDENRDNSNYCDKANNLICQSNNSIKGISWDSKIQNNQNIPNFVLELQDNSKDIQEKDYVSCNDVDLENDFKEFKYSIDEKLNRDLEDLEEIICNADNKSENSVIKPSSGEETGDEGDSVYTIHKIDDSDADSYHSSDFEFIDELESTKQLPINLDGMFCSSVKSNNIETTNKFTDLDDDIIINDYFIKHETNVAKDRVVPTGNDFNSLFLSSCIPHPTRNMENKAVESMRGMEVCHSTGFNLKFLHLQSEPDDNYKEEAYESAKIILSMYPNENRGRRPQRHSY